MELVLNNYKVVTSTRDVTCLDQGAVAPPAFFACFLPRDGVGSLDTREREVQAIDSAAGLNAFIVKRMREPLREDHPRQPLMWERLLDFILKGL